MTILSFLLLYIVLSPNYFYMDVLPVITLICSAVYSSVNADIRAGMIFLGVLLTVAIAHSSFSYRFSDTVMVATFLLTYWLKYSEYYVEYNPWRAPITISAMTLLIVSAMVDCHTVPEIMISIVAGALLGYYVYELTEWYLHQPVNISDVPLLISS